MKVGVQSAWRFLPVMGIFWALHAQAESGSININGNAVLWVEPDHVQVILEVQKVGDSAALANSAVKKVVLAVLDVARQGGVTEHDITTSGVFYSQVRPHANQCRADQIQAAQNITVNIREMDQVESLLDRFVETSALVEGVQPGVTDMEKYQSEALGLAVQQAKENAARLSGHLGITVGKPTTVTATLAHPKDAVHAAANLGVRGPTCPVRYGCSSPFM